MMKRLMDAPADVQDTPFQCGFTRRECPISLRAASMPPSQLHLVKLQWGYVKLQLPPPGIGLLTITAPVYTFVPFATVTAAATAASAATIDCHACYTYGTGSDLGHCCCWSCCVDYCCCRCCSHYCPHLCYPHCCRHHRSCHHCCLGFCYCCCCCCCCSTTCGLSADVTNKLIPANIELAALAGGWPRGTTWIIVDAHLVLRGRPSCPLRRERWQCCDS